MYTMVSIQLHLDMRSLVRVLFDAYRSPHEIVNMHKWGIRLGGYQKMMFLLSLGQWPRGSAKT